MEELSIILEEIEELAWWEKMLYCLTSEGWLDNDPEDQLSTLNIIL